MKKQLLLLVMMLLPMVAMAETEAVEIDGIYYNLVSKGDNKIAEVTYNPNQYTGSVVIHEIVNYEGIEYSVTSIGSYAFSDCTGLTSLTIPNSVTSIGSYAFSGCSGLTSFTIPQSVTDIGIGAFRNCCSLTTITIPNSVMSIGDHVFSYCTGLTSVTVPNSVTSIGISAFENCSGLTSITIPYSVKDIGNNAFLMCSGLTSVTIPNGVKSIEVGVFGWCSGLVSVTIPNSVTSIKNNAFYHCSGLTSVTIPNSVTSIGSAAFSGCSGLTSVVIGGGVKTINGGAFANCLELTDVTCYAEIIPSTQSSAFNGSYIEYAMLHVPDASVNAYSQAVPWKNFKKIVGLNGTPPVEPEKCATPTISYSNGKLTFACDTEGTECVATIDDSDIKTYYGNEVNLTATYNISVYATKNGYDNSDVATATLCWIDVDPKTEGLTDGIANVPAHAVLIQSNGGQLTIQGINDGTTVNVYSINGTEAGSAVSSNGSAMVSSNLQPGSIAIVKIGEKSVKVIVK